MDNQYAKEFKTFYSETAITLNLAKHLTNKHHDLYIHSLSILIGTPANLCSYPIMGQLLVTNVIGY